MVSKNALPHDPRTPVKSVKVMGKNRALLGKISYICRERNTLAPSSAIGRDKFRKMHDSPEPHDNPTSILTSLIEYSILNDLHV